MIQLKGIDALFNTLFERNGDGGSDEGIIAFTERQALMTEMLVRGYPQAINENYRGPVRFQLDLDKSMSEA